MPDIERDYGIVLKAGGQGHESVGLTVIETVRDEALKKRLLDFLLEGRIERLCAMPAAVTVMLLYAAETCVLTGTYNALKEFDPSLTEVNKQELQYGASLADTRFFKNHPGRTNFAQLHRVLMLWFEKRAVQQIEWSEE